MSDLRLPNGCGFVFAATGASYIALARRAARSLRLIHPEAEIDLFADADPDDPVFSQVHILSESWFRPKMEALIRARFERTIFLDADLMVIASLAPVFETLEHFDIAAAQDRKLNSDPALNLHTRPIPAAFATINSGVMGVRRSSQTEDFLNRWKTAVKESGAAQDQPALRELLFEATDIRFATLPPGFNLLTFNELPTWWGMFGAPRVLHSPRLHRRRGGAGDPTQPFTIDEVVGRVNGYRVRALLHADRHVTPDAPTDSRNMYQALEPAPIRWLRNRALPLYRKLRFR